MYKKSKARPSIKVEKENKNFELRKTINILTPDRRLVNKKQTVWDRLSKVKKAPSTENVSGLIRPRVSLTTKTSQHFQAMNQSQFNQSMQLAGSISRRFSVPKKVSSQKITVASDINEILTAQSFSDDSRLSSNTPIALYASSEEANEDYKLAPLMNYGSDSMSSIRIRSRVREFLQNKENAMDMEDIELVKDVVKSDSRYRNLDKNSILFEDILKTQLQNILKQEFAVKKALDSLEYSASLQQSFEIESIKPINKIVSYSGHNKETQKFEVDVIFKNVPSLDKEIEILRALGEKLEATLRTTTSHRSRRDDSVSHRSFSLTTKPFLRLDDKNQPAICKLKHQVYILTAGYNVEESAQLIGIRHHIGIVNEFYITQKTIVELKRESNLPFYISSNSESVQLIRTSFNKLKETPSELLRHVKQKNSKIAFNILEQDPVFFKNIFHKTLKGSKIPYNLSTNCHQYLENELAIKQSLCEDGDSILWETPIREANQNVTNVSNNIELTSFKSESRDDIDIQLIKTPAIVKSVIRGKQRRRIRRGLTPMPFSNYYNPKNALFKTILVGIAQMSVFIILIMALTYPDVRC